MSTTITTEKTIIFGLDKNVYRWLDTMSAQPSSAFVYNLNDMVSKLKAAAVWDQLDRIWLFATEDRQHAKICLKSLSAVTEVNTPFWQANRGFSGNGSTTYLNLNYTPSSNSINYTLNNASYGGYIKTKSDTAFTTYLGGWSPGTRDTNMGVYNSFSSALNTSGGLSQAVNYAAGFFSSFRINATTLNLVYNGATVLSNTAAVAGLPTVSMYALCRNANGTPSNYSTNEVSMVYFGSGEINQTKMYQIFQEFATRQGFNV